MPEKPVISRFLSVLTRGSGEAEFRQEVLPKHRRLAFKLCLLLVVAMPIFMLSDHMVVKLGHWEPFLLAQRLTQISICLVFLFIIRNVKSYSSYLFLVSSSIFLFFVLLELGSITFRDDYDLYILFDIIIVICLYASGILPLKQSLALCLYHSVVAIFIVLSMKKLQVHDQIVVILAYSFSNGVGILLGIAHHKGARQEYLLKHSLHESSLQLKALAYRDSLTNALNRRAFQEHFSDFKRLSERIQDGENDLYLIAADIDHFKLINDNLGHDVGDKVLVAFTQLIESQIRPQDHVYRFGGEEFTILMLDCPKDIAIKRVEQVMLLLYESRLGVEELDLPVTCSFGITPVLESDTVDSVCIRADKALYQAKNNGRNQYVFNSGVS